jgi:hypothetical protein
MAPAIKVDKVRVPFRTIGEVENAAFTTRPILIIKIWEQMVEEEINLS